MVGARNDKGLNTFSSLFGDIVVKYDISDEKFRRIYGTDETFLGVDAGGGGCREHTGSGKGGDKK